MRRSESTIAPRNSRDLTLPSCLQTGQIAAAKAIECADVVFPVPHFGASRAIVLMLLCSKSTCLLAALEAMLLIGIAQQKANVPPSIQTGQLLRWMLRLAGCLTLQTAQL